MGKYNWLLCVMALIPIWFTGYALRARSKGLSFLGVLFTLLAVALAVALWNA